MSASDIALNEDDEYNDNGVNVFTVPSSEDENTKYIMIHS